MNSSWRDNIKQRKWISPFLLGFLALSFQIIFLREFSAHFFGNEITFGIVLAAWLFWGGWGSLWADKIKYSSPRLEKLYFLVILLFPVCLLVLRFSRFFLKTLPGETVGLVPVILFALILTFFLNFPLGILFVFNARYLQGRVSKVYLLESAGSVLGGLAIHFLFIPYVSNWQTAAILGGLACLVNFHFISARKMPKLFIFSFLSLFLFFLLDMPAQKIIWKPFNLIKSKDTLHGKIQVIKSEEQLSLYNNNAHIYTVPDLASAEEAVHFAMLQKPLAHRVLLIGGGAGGSLSEILKYPNAEVEYVELDAEIIRLSLRFLPKRKTAIFSSPRVSIIYADGRAYLSKVRKQYDIILLNLPEPITAQLNRFYTYEFFQESLEKLAEGGIFSLRIPSSENYISSDLQNFLSSLHRTLLAVFTNVQVVPGSTNIFLASNSSITLNVKMLSHLIESLNLNNTFVSPYMIEARLSKERKEFLKNHISSKKGSINRDFKPISYFYNSVLWTAQFRSFGTKILRYLSKIKQFWLLDVPLFLFLSLLLIMGFKKNKTFVLMMPVAVMGLTTIITEILVILSFQTLFGHLYHQIAFLFSCFMGGLCLGGLIGTRIMKPNLKKIFIIQGGFLLLLFGLGILIRHHHSEPIYFLFLTAMGLLGGSLFVLSNNLYLKFQKKLGLGYGLDLLGSFLGAMVVSSILIPLAGLLTLTRYLLLLNSLVFLFIFWRLRSDIFLEKS